jgi:hypothetical protein
MSAFAGDVYKLVSVDPHPRSRLVNQCNNADFRVHHLGLRGYGVVCIREFAANNIICQYQGDALSLDELNFRWPRPCDRAYVYRLSATRFVDASF